MALRRLVGGLLAVACLTFPAGQIRGDEPPAVHPASRGSASGREEAEATAPKADKLDKAETAKQAAKDEEEFYDLYKSLADTVDQVDRNYVKKVSRRELMEAAIKGVLSKLDPYSSYISRDEAGRFKTPSRTNSAASAFRSRWIDNQLKILSPLVGTPAYKAGLHGRRPHHQDRRRIDREGFDRRSGAEAQGRRRHERHADGGPPRHRRSR